jgi:hypothetical protein
VERPIYEEAQRGWFYTGEMNPQAKSLYKFGEWNHYRIEAIGPRCACGSTAAGGRRHRRGTSVGFIGLQVHSIESPRCGRTTTLEEPLVQTST